MKKHRKHYSPEEKNAILRRHLWTTSPNSAIGCITPESMLAGRQQEIDAERDRKLEETRKQRQIRRQQAA